MFLITAEFLPRNREQHKQTLQIISPPRPVARNAQRR
jgi:hypothetical protein